MLDRMQFQNLFKKFIMLFLLIEKWTNMKSAFLKLDIKLHLNDSERLRMNVRERRERE